MKIRRVATPVSRNKLKEKLSGWGHNYCANKIDSVPWASVILNDQKEYIGACLIDKSRKNTVYMEVIHLEPEAKDKGEELLNFTLRHMFMEHEYEGTIVHCYATPTGKKEEDLHSELLFVKGQDHWIRVCEKACI